MCSHPFVALPLSWRPLLFPACRRRVNKGLIGNSTPRWATPHHSRYSNTSQIHVSLSVCTCMGS